MIPLGQKAAPAVSEVLVDEIPIVKSRSKRTSKSNNLTGYLFISPWLISFIVFTVIPIVASFVLSFTQYDILSAPKWIGLDNFERMLFKDARYWKSVSSTFYYVFTAIPMRLIFALLVAMLLNNHFRFTSFYRAAFYAPSIIGGSIAVAVMWRQVFGKTGLVNFLTGLLGIPAVNWLGNPSTAIWTLIVLAVWQFGSPMLIFLAGLKQIPQELYEAASIDGAGATSKFFNITLPMLSPVIFFNLVMQMISGFMVFTQAFIVTGGAPLDTTLFYALYLYRRAFETFEMGYASAMAWALLLIIGIFTAITFKFSSYWVYYEQKEN
jgi:multiple sugar transport system permease protein